MQGLYLAPLCLDGVHDFAGEMMEIQAVRARYANQALWLEQPLEIPEGAQVQVFIQVQSDEPLSSEEQKRRLEAWLGAIRGISVPLDAIRRETIYED